MQGGHIFQQELFSIVDLEKLIPKNHLLRKVDKVVDLSFIRNLTKDLYHSTMGRPSIDPEIYFRIILIGYLYGISSDRKLCEEIMLHLAYRWFCKLSLSDEVPDHSSLTWIRDRLGEDVFKSIFDEIIRQCKNKGLVDGSCVISDGSLIKADASVDSMQPTEGNEGKLKSNKTHKSTTDPESSLVKRAGKARALQYKVHNTIDSKYRVILDSYVSTGILRESQIYLSRIDQLLKKNKIKVAIADRGYGSGEILSHLKDREIKSVIPLYNSQTGSSAPSKESGFVYDRERDTYICPEGHVLKKYPSLSGSYKVFHADKKNCMYCRVSSSCETNVGNFEKRIVRRSIYQDVYEETSSYKQTEEFQELYKQRGWKVEGIFAEAKNNHTLSRAKYRGKVKVQIQAYMVATTQNIKRLVSVKEFILGYLENLNKYFTHFYIFSNNYSNFRVIETFK